MGMQYRRFQFTQQQQAAYDSVKWLFDPTDNTRATGRSTLLSKIQLDMAFDHLHTPIRVFTHVAPETQEILQRQLQLVRALFDKYADNDNFALRIDQSSCTITVVRVGV